MDFDGLIGGPSAAAIASGGFSGYGGPGVAGPDGGTGRGGRAGSSISAAQAASPGQEAFGQGGRGGWGSADISMLISGLMKGLSMAIPGLAPLAAATIVPDFLSLADMDISRPIPAMTPEEVMNQSGGPGQPTGLPSISTPAPAPAPVEAAPPVDSTAFNKQLMDQYISTILSAPSGGGRGIRGVGRPGYKAQQKQTADDWLAKYWRE